MGSSTAGSPGQRGAARGRVLLATCCAVLLTVGWPPAPASAAARAESARDQAASSGRWATIASESTTAPATGVALSLTAARSNNVAHPPRYFWVYNTGTLPLLATTYALSGSSTTATPLAVEACSTTWDERAGAVACSGTISTVVALGASRAGAAPAAAGARVRLRLPGTAKNEGYSASLTVSVSRAQARARTTTTS